MLSPKRHKERHRTDRIGWLRAAVLGANDGIVSTASLVLGVASASASHASVLVAGVAGLVAGAMSMAAGEYVSVHSQADTENADLNREREELEHAPAAELRELTAIYVGRGLSYELATQVAEQLTRHDALGAHARDELGLSDTTSARPIQAALASAASFAVGAILPLAVTALSVPLLGERVGVRRWAAVGAGFLGVLVILRPGLGVVQPASLVALVAMLLYGLYQVLTRLAGRVDGAETSLLWQLGVGAAMVSFVVPFAWRTPPLVHWPLFLLVAALGGVAHYAMIRALQLAPAAVIQPFSYTLLLWAVIIGYLGFGDLPDRWTVLGGAAIVGAGLYTAVREHRLRQARGSA